MPVDGPGHPARPLLTRAEHDRHRRRLDELRRMRDVDLPRRLRDARGFAASDAVEEIVQISVDRYTRTGAVRSYRVGGIAGPDRERFVSARSPVGQALLGRVAGDIVSVTLPDGTTEERAILSIADGDDDAAVRPRAAAQPTRT